MKRVLALTYSVTVYLLFFATFLYLIAFVGNWWVPKSIDTGTPGALATSVIIDVLLVALFGVQHTIMARQKFKDWWTRYVPKVAERSTFVLIASLILILMFWQWRPLTQVVWSVESPAGVAALTGLCLLGWATMLYTTFLINHFELFGLQQGWNYLRGQEAAQTKFRKPTLYKFSRHPMMLAVTVAFWATPVMTVGHLVFSLAFTAYILIGIRFEERELVHNLGDAYREYQQTTPMLIPGLGSRTQPTATAASSVQDLALSGTER